jgi:predicted phage terminase large subunit-like protein
LSRRTARKSLPDYVHYLDLGYQFASHHKLLMSELEAVERGETKRLMVLMPPGSAKSTYASILFPSWYVGKNPNKLILGVSNTTDLAHWFSGRVRTLVEGDAFKNVFTNDGLSKTFGAVHNWKTVKGGEYYAAGIGSAIAGRRADLGLIDDPIKSRADADSERTRQLQWDWYLSDFLPRLKPNARQIVIQTRWNEDDLGGRILEREANRWKVIKIPMEARENDPLNRLYGERLWADYFTDEMIATAKMDARGWNSLYQQDPIPDEGTFFKKEHFIEFDGDPAGLSIYGASDMATTPGGGDFTEHGIFGVDASHNIYVLDWWRGQESTDVSIDAMIDLIRKWYPIRWFGEAGVIRRAIEPFLMRRMIDRNAQCHVEWLPSISSKPDRCKSIQGMAYTKSIMLRKNAPWRPEILKQLLQFPNGKHDDAADVFGLIGRGLQFISPPKPIKRPTVYEMSTGWMG